MSTPPHQLDQVPEEALVTLRAYVRNVMESFGDQLEAVVLYGSAVRGEYLSGRSNLNLLLLLKECDRSLLARYVKLHKRWAKEQIIVPLFLTEGELRAMVPTFPVEIWEMQTQHRVLSGRDPFLGLHVDQRVFPEAVERELRGHLLRLNQRLVEGGATEEAILVLLPLAITSLLPSLRALQVVLGRPAETSSELVLKDLDATLSLDLSGMRDAWNLKRGIISPGKAEVPRLFDRYATTIRQLLGKIVELKQQGRF